MTTTPARRDTRRLTDQVDGLDRVMEDVRRRLADLARNNQHLKASVRDGLGGALGEGEKR